MDTMNALVWKGDGALSLERRPIPAQPGRLFLYAKGPDRAGLGRR